MDSQLFDTLKQRLESKGPAAAAEELCTALRQRKDYAALFYALLLKKRVELGVSPMPTGPASDLPEAVHASYEDAIREAGRLVGNLFLDEGNIPNAWAYFRMLGEPGPVAQALEQVQPQDGEDIHPLVDIAFHQGVQPRRGFDLILQHFGICSAITTLGGVEQLPFDQQTRLYCVKRLVRALYDELKERLRVEITRQQGFEPTAKTVRELIQGRDWLFAEDYYHIDISHLSAVVQMATQLDRCAELDLARELCEYGKKLSPRFSVHSDPPFENQYQDYGVYLDILAGHNVEEGLAHFRKKAEEADPEEIGTYPAQVLVNLLLRLDRPKEALEIARKHLAHVGDAPLSCPNLYELCQRTGDFHTLAEVAREQGHAVQFMAGLIGAGKK